MALRKVTETEGKPGLMVALDSFAISRVGDALGVVHHVGVGETLRADSWIVLQAPSLFAEPGEPSGTYAGLRARLYGDRTTHSQPNTFE